MALARPYIRVCTDHAGLCHLQLVSFRLVMYTVCCAVYHTSYLVVSDAVGIALSVQTALKTS